MFYQKKIRILKEKITNLESLLDSSDDHTRQLLKENDFLKRCIDNPPKFSIGQTIKNLMILSVKPNYQGVSAFSINNGKFHANIFAILCGLRPVYDKDEVSIQIKQNKSLFKYKVFNEKTNKTEYILEDDLTQIKNHD